MEYQGFIFTKHALERLDLRSLQLDQVVATLQNPEQTRPTDKEGTVRFIRHLNGREIHVVATHLVAQKKWLVVSVWVRGEEDPVPFIWTLIIAPFKLIWWLIRWSWRTLYRVLRRTFTA